MITSIQKIAEGKAPCTWWDDVPQLRKRKFEFKPGLNIIVGPNGSGKTTLTRTIARMLYCEEGGRQAITQNAVKEMNDMAPMRWSFGDEDKSDKGKDEPEEEYTHRGTVMELVHDNAPVFYFNPTDKIGADKYNRMNDFFSESLYIMGNEEEMSNPSSGEANIAGFNRMDLLIRNAYENNKFYSDHYSANSDVWKDMKQHALDVCEAIDSNKPFTFIMDEPDRSTDILNQAMFWNCLQDRMGDNQTIICAHNYLSIGIKDAHYIETEEGYYDKCVEQLN